MSREGVTVLLREIRESGAFAAQVAEDRAILTGYDLTPDEREALIARDEDALRRMGVPGELVESVRVIGRPNRR